MSISWDLSSEYVKNIEWEKDFIYYKFIVTAKQQVGNTKEIKFFSKKYIESIEKKIRNHSKKKICRSTDRLPRIQSIS